MSARELLKSLLQTTGPVVQGLAVLHRLQTHFRARQQDATAIDLLQQLLLQTRQQLQRLHIQTDRCAPNCSAEGLEKLDGTMTRVKDDLENAFSTLQHLETSANNSPTQHFLKGSTIAADCEHLQQVLESTNTSLVQLSTKPSLAQLNRFHAAIEAIHTASVSHTETDQMRRSHLPLRLQFDQMEPQMTRTPRLGDAFTARTQRQTYPREALCNFDETSVPNTIECRVKQQLLNSDQVTDRIIAVQGEAGVGKTTTLNMLSQEPTIQAHFVDGIYFMTLGADASSTTVINQLRAVVLASGGWHLARDAEKWTNVRSAIELTSQWFKDRTFLLLIDDAWDTIAMGTLLEDIISQIALTTACAAFVFTTSNPEVSLNGKVFQLKRRHPHSRESRAMLMRYAQYEEDTKFDETSEEAIHELLGKTAGLPVAHAVIGRAVASYKAGSNSEISPWVWYVGISKSIIGSSDGKYSSLNVIFASAIQSLDLGNEKPRYKRMYESLCVFEKNQWILVPVLVRLWELDSNSVKKVCRDFVKVGLAQWHEEQVRNDCMVEGIMIHDLLHDFATERAGRNQTFRKWHDHLFVDYSMEAGVAMNGKHYLWWNLTDTDHGYPMKNLFRHILASGTRARSMKHIASRPEWIASQLVTNGILQYQNDVALALEQMSAGPHLNSYYLVNDATLGQIFEAVKLSASSICSNPLEVRFQLHGRLLHAQESISMNAYLRDIEGNAPGPWLKPLSKCLTCVESMTTHLLCLDEAIRCMVVISGDEYVACGCSNGYIIIISIQSNIVKRKWKAHKGDVRTICTSPSGRFIASGSNDSTVKLWDCKNWEQMKNIVTGHNNGICAVAISKDEETLYTASNDRTVRSWNVDTCENLSILLKDIDPSEVQLTVLVNENLVVKVGHERKFRILRVKENKKPRVVAQVWNQMFGEMKKEMEFVGSSKDGTKFVTRNRSGNFNVWNSLTMMKRGFIKGPLLWRSTIPLDIRDQRLAIPNIDGTVTVYEEIEHVPENRYNHVGTYNLGTLVTGLKLIGVGDTMLSCTVTGTVQLLELGKPKLERAPRSAETSKAFLVTHTPEGKYFITGHVEGEIYFWETSTGKQSGNCVKIHDGVVSKIEVSENGEWIVSVATDYTVAVCNVESREVTTKFKIENCKDIAGLDVHNDGTRVILQYKHGVTHMWNSCNTNNPVLVIPEDRRAITSNFDHIWFLADSNCFVSVSREWIEEWDISSESLIKVTKFHRRCMSTSRRDVLYQLRNADNQLTDAPEEFFSISNVIQYGGIFSRRTVCTLESYIADCTFSALSNTLCVLVDEQIHFLRFYDN